MHTVLIDVMARAGCEHPEIYPDIGLAAPNTMYTNIAKYLFANDGHESSKVAADITGGIASTIFTYKDWVNPEERPYIEKYLAGKGGIPTEHRLRAIRLMKDMIGHGQFSAHIHTEGSLAAQRIMMYAAPDWEKYKAIAKRSANIPGWEEHPAMKELGLGPRLSYPI